MNNEEKILEMLLKLEAKVDANHAEVLGGQAKLEAGQRAIRKDIAKIKHELKDYVWTDILKLDRRITRLEEMAEIR